MFKDFSHGFGDAKRSVRRRPTDDQKLSFQSLEDRRLLATFTVTNNSDGSVAAAGDLVGSLRQAIFDANANPGADTIEFDSSVFTGGDDSLIRLTAGELEITDSLSIDGATGTDVTITGDANGDDGTLAGNITDLANSFGSQLDDNSRVLNFSSTTGDLTLEGLSITGGLTTGDNSYIPLDEGFETTYSGGGIRSITNGSVVLTDTTVSGNGTAGYGARGGGIFTSFGTVTLIDSTISGNSTSQNSAGGGGIYTTYGSLSLTNTTVSGNRTGTGYGFYVGSYSNGGGIATGAGSPLSLTNSVVTENNVSADRATGGGISTGAGTVTLIDSTVSGNSTSGIYGVGGGISTVSGSVSLENSTVSGNSTTLSDAHGGGVYSRLGEVSLFSSTVSGNRVAGTGSGPFLPDSNGGGIYAHSGAVNVNYSTVSGNSTTGGNGGGISTYSGVLSLTNSTVSGNNTQGGNGGGISTGAGTVNLFSSTVVGNTVFGNTFVGSSPDGNILIEGSGSGGGVFVFNAPGVDLLSSPTPSIVHSIVAGNFENEDTPGDLVFNEAGLATFNSLIGVGDGLGLITTPFFGLVGEGADLRFVSFLGNLVGTAASPLDPQLGPLTNNGGRTQTHALLPGSPAIDAGSNSMAVGANGDELLFDQRITAATSGDLFRIVDTLDIGSVEFDSDLELPSLVVTTGADSVNSFDGVTSLREAVNFANFNPGDDTIEFDASVFTGGSNSLIRLTEGELEITDTLTIDGSTGTDVTITGDANGDDITLAGNITDVVASGDELLDDNSRVLNFSSNTLDRDLMLVGLAITGGSSTSSGGGIRFTDVDGLVSLTNSAVSGNSTTGNDSIDALGANGGGLFVAGSLGLTNSIVSGNGTTGYFSDGGGIFSTRGSVTLNHSTVSGNTTSGNYSSGGAIYHTSGSGVTLINSTVSGNSTTGRYSGIAGIDSRSSAVSLTGSTVTGNRGGYGISVFSPFIGVSLTIENSIVAGNTSVDGLPGDLFVGGNDSLTINHSLIGVADGLSITGNVGNLTGTAALPLDPQLGPLADNGGSTFTHALLPGSPAIDAGSNLLAVDQDGMPLTTDQRGFARLFDSTSQGTSIVDIGAFELNSISPLVPTVTRDEGGVLARPDLLSTYAVLFNQDVNISADDLTIRNETLGGTVVDSSGLEFVYDSITRTATWDFADLILDPAFYTFELSEDIASVDGSVSLDGDLDGNPGGVFVDSVYVALLGDANLDGQVDVLNDAFTLVGNLGLTGGATWAQGDFNGDGNVNVLGDAFILVANLGQSVVPPTAASKASIVLANDPILMQPSVSVDVGVSLFDDQEDDLPKTGSLSAAAKLSLAGSQALDAAFEPGNLVDDGLF